MSDLIPLQILTFAKPPEPSKRLGQRGEFLWIPLNQLRVDPVYQRDILEAGKANIRKMVEEFSWEKFGVLDVARRGPNVYAIIDGQHRATAALIHGGIDAVPCFAQKRSVAEEARAFAAINHNVTRINALQSFRAAVAGEDPEAVAIVACLASVGTKITGRPKSIDALGPGETCALSAIRTCFKRYGPDALANALSLLRIADPNSGLPGSAVHAVCMSVPKHDDWQKEPGKFGELLARTGGGLVKMASEAAARRGNYGGPEWVNFVAIMEARISTAQRTAGQDMRRLMAGR